MPEINRSVKYKTNLKMSDILPTMNEWLRVCNIASKIAFENNCVSNHIKLHRLTYSEIRINSTLTSQLACNAIRHVASKYSTARSNKHKLEKPILFKQQSISLQMVYDFSYGKKGLSISTITGRIKNIKISTYKHAEQYTNWKRGGATLQIKNNHIYFIQAISTEIPELTEGNTAGLDKGINYLAVITDGKKQLFFKGGKAKNIKNRYRNTRASLQKKKALNASSNKPTRSVRRVLKRLSGRENRFMRDTNHCVSKKVVKFAVDNHIAVIAAEQLEGIRDSAKNKGRKMRTMINGWSFYQLQSFIEYKSAAYGIKCEELPAAYSSQGCSKCGYTAKSNRKKHDFECGFCSYRLHSDLNASRNMRMRSIMTRQDLCHDGLPVNQPLSTGLTHVGSGASLHPCGGGI